MAQISRYEQKNHKENKQHEKDKLIKDTWYVLIITSICAVLAAVSAIISPVLVVLLTKS